MIELIQTGIGFIALAAALAIGGGIVVLTQNQVVNITGNSSLLDTLIASTGTALTTFSSMLAVLALAITGGLALWYILRFFRPGE